MSAMSLPGPDDHTALIELARSGDDDARRRLFELLYEDLKTIARRSPRVGRPGETLQPTAIVNEFFIEVERRFPPPPKEIPESRRTFYRTAALVMRTILRDHARTRVAMKRGGGRERVPVELDRAEDDQAALSPEEFLAIDQALLKLEQRHPRWFEVVLQRFFAGRTIEETAMFLGIAPSTVSADWKLARAWLYREISNGDA